ncbi:hypothetical protein niasHT_016779 [Heterodera trifolii]|uniref:PIH1 N-terminal domain-containing protein n=1 Tax=Heterodera trifolii TaxID=157864 RepID=A0ABD2LEV3_9BILA
MPASSRVPLIVERRSDETEEDTWTVYPTAGICIKFKEAHFSAASSVSDPSTSKFFINLAHCTELPPPHRHAELDEDKVAQMVEEDPDAFRIPICVGELDRSAEDRSGEAVAKVDVLVNSEFFHKRISQSEFFRQLTLRIVCQAIEIKHSLRVDIAKQVILRNKKCIGELCAQRIRKRPTTTTEANGEGKVKEKTDSKEEEDEEEEKERTEVDQMLDIEENGEKRRPRNFKVQIVDGKYADVRIRMRDHFGELVKESDRITLKMNNDRIVVLVDGCTKCADFFLPVDVKDDQSDAFFEAESATLRLKCPIDWN